MHSDQVVTEVHKAVVVHQGPWVRQVHLEILAHLVYQETQDLQDLSPTYSHSWIRFKHLKGAKKDLPQTLFRTCKHKLDQ